MVMPARAGASAAFGRNCSHCGKAVAGGTYVSGVFYCPMCASAINRNYACADGKARAACDPCLGCPGNPAANPDASGICHCAAGIAKFRWAR